MSHYDIHVGDVIKYPEMVMARTGLGQYLFSGSARVFVYSVFRGVLNRVYGILQLKYGYSVYHFL